MLLAASIIGTAMISVSEASKSDCTSITIGSTVKVGFPNGKARCFTITNQLQCVTPDRGIISDQSPLGHALLNKTVGSLVTYSVGTQQFSVKILEMQTSRMVND